MIIITSVSGSHFDINGRLYERVYGISHNEVTYSFYSKFNDNDSINGSSLRVDNTSVNGQQISDFTTVEDFINAIREVSFNNSVKNSGFIDYNNSAGAVSIVADTWTDVTNDGLGSFTNKTYKPDGVSELMDNNTGYLDFSELTLGSELIVRNDFTVNPNTNNSLLEVRYLLGQGGSQYALKFWSERLDNGSGIDYQRVVPFPIYMGDLNTQGGVGKLQVRLSTNGTINNSGSYISVQVK